MEKIKLPVLNEPGKEIQIDFSGKLHSKHVTDEPYNFIGIDRYSKWPVVRVCKSTETKGAIKFLESFSHLYGVPEETKSDRGNAFIYAFISKEYKIFRKNKNIKI